MSKLFATLLILFLAPAAMANNKFYVECNGCSEGKMKVKAVSVRLIGSSGESHVFNEKDKIYRKYRIYKETVTGPGNEPRETSVKTTAIQTSPNLAIKDAFEEYVDAKRIIDRNVEGMSLTLYANDVVQMNTPLRSAYKATSDERCTSREVASDEKTAHDYIKSRSNREDLFDAVNQEFDSSGVGNMTEFFARHKKLFDTIAAAGISIGSNIGHTLSVIGANSNEIEILTPDNGRMFVALDFRRELATIQYASDGNCNEIPLNESAPMVGEYRFDSITGMNNMEELLGSLGASFKGTYLSGGFRCGQYVLTCSITNGTRTCTRSCGYWKND